jgi:hypothetical protein
MDELQLQMMQAQRYFISRMGLGIEDYVDTSAQDIVARSQPSLSESMHGRLAQTAALLGALHGDIRRIFGSPISSLQREDDLFMMLELVSSLARKGALSIQLERGGLFKTSGADILMGTAPIRRFNAYVAPGGSPSQLIILFDDEIAITLVKLARSFAGRITRAGDRISLVDDETAIRDGISRQHFEGAASILLGMLYDGHGREGLVSEIPEEFAETSATISRLSMQFVLLHELGHVALGHLRNPSATFLALPDSAISEWTIDHQHELDADAEALSVFKAYCKGQPDALSGFAFALPLALFTALDALLLLVDAPDPDVADFQALNYTTGTHPSPSVRIAHLRSLLRSTELAAFDDGFRFCAECLITVAQRAARMVRESRHFQGLAIHPRWQGALAGIRSAASREQAKNRII